MQSRHLRASGETDIDFGWFRGMLRRSFDRCLRDLDLGVAALHKDQSGGRNMRRGDAYHVKKLYAQCKGDVANVYGLL